MLNESVIEITSSKVSVVSGTLDDERSLVESDDRNGVVRMSNIDKGDVAGGLINGGKVGLGDSISESGSGDVVDESERVQSSDFGGIHDGSSLDFGVPNWNGDNDIVDGPLELLRGGVTKLSKEHRVELSRRENGRLAEVLHLSYRRISTVSSI